MDFPFFGIFEHSAYPAMSPFHVLHFKRPPDGPHTAPSPLIVFLVFRFSPEMLRGPILPLPNDPFLS